MKKNVIVLIFILMLAGCSSAVKKTDETPILGNSILKKIDASVFEVVVPKPKRDTLTYEEALPVDQLSYSERNSDYMSVGTAFAIAENTFITAAHVFSLEKSTLLSNPLIKDKHGRVYNIDKITKYSSNRDFVVFTVKNIKVSDALPIKYNPDMNEPVFTVGNALGDGIVIRNGVLTSETPEDVANKWRWLRFSAPASPGNSGGPLLDRNGNIIGIITMKSQNENLNYALPVSELANISDNTCVIDKNMFFTLNNYDKKLNTTYRYEAKLPLSYSALHSKLLYDFEKFNARSMDEFKQKYKDDLFPNGKGASELLYTTLGDTFPNLTAKGENGAWGFYVPSNIKRSNISTSGILWFGEIAGFTVMNLKKPSDIGLKELLENPKKISELCLEGLNITRNMGTSSIKITSLNDPAETYDFTDSYGRKWKRLVWNMDFADGKVMAVISPTPQGFTALAAYSDTDYIERLKPDIADIADFVTFSYYGTFKNWKEFSVLSEYLPAFFGNMSFDYSENKNTALSIGGKNYIYDNSLFDITGDSDLSIAMIYSSKADKFEINQVTFGENKNTGTCLRFGTVKKPIDTLPDSYKGEWYKIENRKHPYNSVPYSDSGKTAIGSSEISDTALVTFLFMDGDISRDEMNAKFDISRKVLK